MRSTEPIPGDPWPHDMQLTIEDHPHALLQLLWIREAHELRPRGEHLPPPLTEPPTVVRDEAVTAETRAAWEDAWPRIWHAVAAHAGADLDLDILDRLHGDAVSATESAELLRRLRGPEWRDDFGDRPFENPSYRAWSENVAIAGTVALAIKLEDTPERRDLAALVPAWQAGLTKIVTIPCRGEFTRRVTDNALLMTAASRTDSAGYRNALRSFLTP